MEIIQNLLDGGTMPVITALLLGLMTAISPCPLATNIAAIGYLGKQIDSPKRVFVNGLLYTLGRMACYTVLGIVLLLIIHEGSSLFGIQKFISHWGERLLGPLMLLVGLFMLFGDKLGLKGFGFNSDGDRVAGKGAWGALLLGVLFALAFCPTSAVFYFGMLIPLAASSAMGWALPVIFALATGLPVLVVAWIVSFSIHNIGTFMNRMRVFQLWFNCIVALVFIGVGLYYTIVMFF